MDQNAELKQLIEQILGSTGSQGPPSQPPQTMWQTAPSGQPPAQQTMWRTAPGRPTGPPTWQTGQRMLGPGGAASPPQQPPQQPQQQPMAAQPALPTQPQGAQGGGQMNIEALLQLLMQLLQPRGAGDATGARGAQPSQP